MSFELIARIYFAGLLADIIYICFKAYCARNDAKANKLLGDFRKEAENMGFGDKTVAFVLVVLTLFFAIIWPYEIPRRIYKWAKK